MYFLLLVWGRYFRDLFLLLGSDLVFFMLIFGLCPSIAAHCTYSELNVLRPYAEAVWSCDHRRHLQFCAPSPLISCAFPIHQLTRRIAPLSHFQYFSIGFPMVVAFKSTSRSEQLLLFPTFSFLLPSNCIFHFGVSLRHCSCLSFSPVGVSSLSSLERKGSRPWSCSSQINRQFFGWLRGL